MTICSRPATDEYRDGWDRVFKREVIDLRGEPLTKEDFEYAYAVATKYPYPNVEKEPDLCLYSEYPRNRS
jgi:hypothetical protein